MDGVWYNRDIMGPVEDDDEEDPRWRTKLLRQSGVLDLYKGVGLHVLEPGVLHTIALWWEPERFFRWFVNGEEVMNVT